MTKSINKMDRRSLAFNRVDFISLAIGMIIVIIGFLLVSGKGSTGTTYNPNAFSVRHIKVVPVVCFIGLVSMTYAIVRRLKDQHIEEQVSIVETIVLTIVGGLAEFLSVSSTGHMIITRGLLGMEANDPFINAFITIIQFSTVLSVMTLYWERLFRLDHTPTPAENTPVRAFLHKQNFYWKLLVAFISAAVIGLLANHLIGKILGSVVVVAVMLVIGGVFMLFCDRLFSHGSEPTSLAEKRTLRVGLLRCIAMIPGVPRSMATIVGGVTQGLTRRRAAEFSFFLAVPTMFVAVYLDMFKLIKSGDVGTLFVHVPTLLLGSGIAFVVALLAMEQSVAFLTKYGFKALGVYRIITGGAILTQLMMGHQLTVVDQLVN